MCRVNAFVRIANFVTLIAWLSACSGQAPAPPEPSPTPTDAEQISLTGTPASQELPPTATPLATWDYIAIGGDFTYAQNWDQFYADYMAEDLGIPVAFSDLSSHSSLTLKGWLEQIQADSELHKALQEAEAVTFDVPIEAYLQMPIAMYQNRLCGGEDGEDCYRERVEELRQDLEAFLLELTALADPTQVLVRTVLRGAIPAYQGEGLGRATSQSSQKIKCGCSSSTS